MTKIVRGEGQLTGTEERVVYMALAMATDRLGGSLTFTRQEYNELLARLGRLGLRLRLDGDAVHATFEPTPGDA